MNVRNLSTGNLTASQLPLAVCPNPEGLHALENTLFEETEASGQPVICNPGEHGAGSIQSGCLEKSNVNLAEEMHALNILQTWKNVIERAILAIHERDKQYSTSPGLTKRQRYSCLEGQENAMMVRPMKMA
jgi:flagellar basal-body rod protein FlgG